MRRVTLYVRVSTADQTTENQERESIAIAAHSGYGVAANEAIVATTWRQHRPPRLR